MLAGDRDRILYPFDTPQSRFSPHDIPSIPCMVRPHLRPDYENLFEDLKRVVRGLAECIDPSLEALGYEA